MKSSTAKSMLLCALSGILLGFSQPLFWPALLGPVGEHQELLGALALVAYVPFFWVIRKENLKATFFYTLFTMTLQYTIVLYWIFNALHDYGDIAVLPSGVITILLPMILALMGSAFFTIGRFISIKFSCSFFIFAPICLTALEYFRNFQIFGGFPWGNIGYSIGRIDEFLQLASLVGVYGLVFFVALINSLICAAIDKKSGKLSFLYGSLALVLVGAAFIFGFLRLKDKNFDFAPSIRIALLQGDIPQEMKNRSRLYRDEILAIYQKLYDDAVEHGAELIIWPESSYPKHFEENIKSLSLSPNENRASVVGLITYGFTDSSSYYHNSALLIDYKGQVLNHYDKTHLVPFGEYVPWPMSGIVDKIVPGMGNFYPGTNFTPQSLALSGDKKLELGVTVCYEGIFPEISRTYALKGATFLVNATNDAWYGRSSAPYQHLLMYRLRSVESGRSFLRATNSGLSAWIDVYGGVHRDLGLFERGAQINDVPLVTKSTFYTRVGDVIPKLCLLILIICYIIAAVPMKSIIKERRYGDLFLIILLIGIVLASHIYYSQARFMTIESASTKDFFIFLLSMIILVGALSRTPRSRNILLVTGAIVFSISLALALFESLYFLFGILLAVLIFLLTMRIKSYDQQRCGKFNI